MFIQSESEINDLNYESCRNFVGTNHCVSGRTSCGGGSSCGSGSSCSGGGSGSSCSGGSFCGWSIKAAP